MKVKLFQEHVSRRLDANTGVFITEKVTRPVSVVSFQDMGEIHPISEDKSKADYQVFKLSDAQLAGCIKHGLTFQAA